jgi:hypothetical protein
VHADSKAMAIRAQPVRKLIFIKRDNGIPAADVNNLDIIETRLKLTIPVQNLLHNLPMHMRPRDQVKGAIALVPRQTEKRKDAHDPKRTDPR